METLNLRLTKKLKTSSLKLTVCFLLAFLSQGIASEDTCPEKELRIILIGKTGVGKSATGNAILGKNAFKTENSVESVTRSTTYNTACRFGWKIVVVDTPGLADTHLSEKDVLTEITKAYTMVSPGPHAFVMLMYPNRFTTEDQKNLNAYTNLLGKGFEKYMVILFTDKIRFTSISPSSFEEFIDGIAVSHPVKRIIKAAENRYLAMDYCTNFENETEDVIKLLELIEKMKQKNNPSYFKTQISWFSEFLYDLLGCDHDGYCNSGNHRDKERETIFEMFHTYRHIISIIVFALGFLHGYTIPVAVAILELLIKIASF